MITEESTPYRSVLNLILSLVFMWGVASILGIVWFDKKDLPL